MDTKIGAVTTLLLILAAPAHGESTAPKYSPTQLLKNHAFTACIAEGLKAGEAAEYAAAAAREYLEHGSLPIEAHTEATLLGRKFLSKEYKNIYGDNLVFIKCIDFYNSKELELLAKKYAGRKGTGSGLAK